jgi:hypothetical protein
MSKDKRYYAIPRAKFEAWIQTLEPACGEDFFVIETEGASIHVWAVSKWRERQLFGEVPEKKVHEPLIDVAVPA